MAAVALPEHDVTRHIVDVAAVHEEVAVPGVADGRQDPGIAHARPTVAPDTTCGTTGKYMSITI